jgi:hypothetical protein
LGRAADQYAYATTRITTRRRSTNKSAPEEFPLDEIDLLVGWRAGKDEYLFTKAVAIVREWLLDTDEKDRLRDVLKEILAEAGPSAANRPVDEG